MTQPWFRLKHSDIHTKFASTLPAVGGSRAGVRIIGLNLAGGRRLLRTMALDVARPAACVAVAGLIAAWLWRRGRLARALHRQLCDPLSGEPLTKAAIFKLRRTLFCAAQSVSYANSDPLLAMRGSEHWLYDENGRAFLDTRCASDRCFVPLPRRTRVRLRRFRGGHTPMSSDSSTTFAPNAAGTTSATSATPIPLSPRQSARR